MSIVVHISDLVSHICMDGNKYTVEEIRSALAAKATGRVMCKCRDCGGSGDSECGADTCPSCNGTGEVAKATGTAGGALTRYKLVSGEQREWMMPAPDGDWCRYDQVEEARQPVPVVAVKTWQERMDGFGGFTVTHGDTATAYVGRSAEIAARDAEIADLRAVLSCLLHQTDGDICEMRKMKATIAELRAALAATNRSQL